jgi:hypothetical protein
VGKAFFFKLIFFGFFFVFFPLSRSSFLFLLSSPLPVPLLSLSLSLSLLLPFPSLSHTRNKKGARRRRHGRDDWPPLRAVAAERDGVRLRGQGRGDQLRAAADLHPADGRERAAAGGQRSGAFFARVSCLFLFLSRAAAAIKKKKGNKKRYETHFFLLTFLFFSLSLVRRPVSLPTTTQLSPLAGARLHRSHGRQRPAPGDQHPGAWFFFLSLFLFFAFTFSFSLSHLFLFPSSRFIFVQPNHNKNSPSSTP